MLRRVLAPALLGLGAVVIALAIASGTLWRPAAELPATTGGLAGSAYLVTEPGVLDLAADDVAVSAVSASGARVVVALATSADIDAWLGGAPSTRVTGLARIEGTEVLAAELREAPEAAEAADPTGSDLWRQEMAGTGRVEFEWSREPGRLGLLVWSDAADATDLTLTLTWPQEVRTPWVVPGIVLGSVLLLAGLGLWVWRIRAARAERERQAALETTAELAAITGAPLTRRQLREAQAHAEGRSPVAARPVDAPLGVPSDPEGAPVAPRTPPAADVPSAGPDAPRPMTRRERRLAEAAAAAAASTPPAPAEPATPPAPAEPATPSVTDPTPRPTVIEVTPVVTTATATPEALSTTTPETPSAAGSAAPVPDAGARPARRLLGLLDRRRRPAPVPEPEPEPEPAADWFPEPTPTSAASADAWRRAWGFPGAGASPADDAATATIPDPATPPTEEEAR